MNQAKAHTQTPIHTDTHTRAPKQSNCVRVFRTNIFSSETAGHVFDNRERALFTVNNKTLKKYNADGTEDWIIQLKGKSVKLVLYAYIVHVQSWYNLIDYR